MATVGDGSAALDAGAHLADRRPGGAPRRRGRRRPRRRVAGRRLSGSARSPASRSRTSSPPTRRRCSRPTGPADATPSSPASSGPRTAGAVGLILTTDWSFSHSRDWGSPPIPQRIDLRDDDPPAPRRQSPSRDGCCAGPAPGCARPSLEVPNFAPSGSAGADVLRRLRRVDADAAADVGRRRLAASSSGTARSCSRA